MSKRDERSEQNYDLWYFVDHMQNIKISDKNDFSCPNCLIDDLPRIDETTFINIYFLLETMKKYCAKYDVRFKNIDLQNKWGYISIEEHPIVFCISIDDLSSSIINDERKEMLIPFMKNMKSYSRLAEIIENGILPWEMQLSDVLDLALNN